MRRAEEADPAGLPLALEPVAGARCQATRLCTCSRSTQPAEEVELGLRAGASASATDGVQIFVATNASRARPAERPAEHALRPAVHRRGVDEPACPPRTPPRRRASRDVLLGVGEVERLPGAEPDDRQLDAGAPESPACSILFRHAWRGRAYWTLPSSRGRAIDARASRRELPRRLAARAALGAAAPARDLRLRAARRQPRRRGRGRPRRRSSTSSSASSTARPQTEIMRRLHATIAARGLPLEPFRRLIEANRIDQRDGRYETWDDVRGYCTYSADPVGRLVLGDLRAGGRAGARGDERRRLHRPPARQLPPGPAARPRARPRLPAAGGSAPLRRSPTRSSPARARSASRPCSASRPSGRARSSSAGLPARTRRSAGEPGCSVALFARGGLAALDALERAELGRLLGPSGSDPVDASPGWPLRGARPPMRRRATPTREVAPHHPPRGAELRVGDRASCRGRSGVAVAALYAFARRVDDIADDPTLDAEERRQRLEGCRAGVDGLPRRSRRRPRARRARRRRRPLPDSATGAARPRGRRADGRRPKTRYASWEELREYCRCVAGAVGLACTAVYGPSDPEARRAARRDARARPPADQHHARRRRGLAARPRLPPAGRARALRRHRGRHRGRPAAGPGGARSWSTRPRAPSTLLARGPRAPAPPRPAQRALRARVRRDLPRAARRRCARRGYDVFSRRPQPLGRRQGAGGRPPL